MRAGCCWAETWDTLLALNSVLWRTDVGIHAPKQNPKASLWSQGAVETGKWPAHGAPYPLRLQVLLESLTGSLCLPGELVTNANLGPHPRPAECDTMDTGLGHLGFGSPFRCF